jgi:GPH family glycoside/pentoside/hexuronide:cation symporter
MGIAMVLLTLVTVLFTRERAYENTSKADGSKTDPTKMMEVLGILLKDKYWRVILICELLLFIALQMPMAGIAYFAMYVLNDMNATSWLMFLTVSSGVIMQFMVPVLIQRVGKHRLCIIGLASAIVAYTVFGLMIPDTALMKPCLIVYGAGKGLFEGMLFGIVADIISYTKDKTGQFIAGVGNAGTSAVNKIGMGIGSILFGFALSTAGFDAALDTQGIAQPAAVVTTTTFMFVWFPIILYSITLVIYVLFFDMYRNQKCA